MAREGRRKHRLIPDPVRAPVVLMIFEDYCLRFLGLGEICEKLNRNLDRFPPPIPNRKDDHGLPPTWSRSVLHGILRNPKYTGFNVWGRHDKRKDRPLIRPRDQWVWSPTPTHDAIVSRELFETVEERSLGKRNSIKAGAIVRAQKSPDRPSTGRVYTLRGRVRCGMCGHRMEGSHQKGSNWYRCQYARRRSQAAATHADHPPVLGIKEEKVLEAALDFLARRVFGPDRLRLLRDELADATASTWESHTADLDRHERELHDIERSLRVQALRLEEHEDPKEETTHDPKCKRPLKFTALRNERLKVSRASAVPHKEQQPRLPHPRKSLDQQQSTTTVTHIFHGLLDDCLLTTALNQRPIPQVGLTLPSTRRPSNQSTRPDYVARAAYGLRTALLRSLTVHAESHLPSTRGSKLSL